MGGKFTNASGLASFTVGIISGLTYGTLFQFIGTYIYYYIISHNCGMYLSEPSCTGLINADCQWHNATCKFPDYATLDCMNFTTPDECGAGGQGSCFYDYGEEVCLHQSGWSPVMVGVFASAPIMGGIFSGLVDGLLKRVRWITVAKLIGIVIILSGVLMTVGHMLDSYAIIIISRLLHGLVAYCATSVGVIYARRRRPDIADSVAMIMQVNIAVGLVVTAIVALALDPKPNLTDEDLHMNVRIQCIFVVCIYSIGVAFLLVGLIVEEPPQFVEAPKADLDKAVDQEDQESFSTCQVILFFVKGACVCLALNGTGIAVYVGFSPAIVGQTGLDPMLGTFLIAIAQFIGSLVGFAPVKFQVTPRRIFLVGLALSVVTCLVTFLGVFPGIIEEGDATVAVTMLGLMLFCVVFNATVGPQSWVLMATVFPQKHMQAGTSVSVTFNALGGLLVNLIFPIAVDAISGGPAGNQGYGYGAMFLVFAFISLGFLVGIGCFVQVYEAPASKDKEEGAGQVQMEEGQL